LLDIFNNLEQTSFQEMSCSPLRGTEVLVLVWS